MDHKSINFNELQSAHAQLMGKTDENSKKQLKEIADELLRRHICTGYRVFEWSDTSTEKLRSSKEDYQKKINYYGPGTYLDANLALIEAELESRLPRKVEEHPFKTVSELLIENQKYKEEIQKLQKKYDEQVQLCDALKHNTNILCETIKKLVEKESDIFLILRRGGEENAEPRKKQL